MGNTNNTFIFNLDWAAVLMEYPAEVRYEVYDAIIGYATSGTLPELKPLAKMAFSFIKKEMDYNRAQYEATIEKRRAAGRLGGLGKQKQAEEANATDAKQNLAQPSNAKQNKQPLTNEAKASYNDNVNVNDNDIIKNNQKDFEHNPDCPEDFELEEEFERFRQAYPGNKRGFSVEFGNFKKKYPKTWKELIPLLAPAVERLLAYHKAATEANKAGAKIFIPNFAYLSTWINNARWEEEFQEIPPTSPWQPEPVKTDPENEPSDFGGKQY